MGTIARGSLSLSGCIREGSGELWALVDVMWMALIRGHLVMIMKILLRRAREDPVPGRAKTRLKGTCRSRRQRETGNMFVCWRETAVTCGHRCAGTAALPEASSESSSDSIQSDMMNWKQDWHIMWSTGLCLYLL